MYDLNQIPYDYTVEVRNRFKGLDLIDTVPDELWNEVFDIVQETGIKTISMEKKCKKKKKICQGHCKCFLSWVREANTSSGLEACELLWKNLISFLF